LREKRVSKIGRPLDVAGQPLDDIWSRRQGLDTGIPWLLGHGVSECFVFQSFISIHPLLKLNDFERISRSSQSLGEQRVWK